MVLRAAGWMMAVCLVLGTRQAVGVESSPSGSIEVLANVGQAQVFLDGAAVGRAPVTLDRVAPGAHVVEVRRAGYADARQPIALAAGEQKILAADMAPLPETRRRARDERLRGAAPFSAATLDPGIWAIDLGAGYLPFGDLRVTVGVAKGGMLGLELGVEARTIGYLTDGLARLSAQLVRAGPLAGALELVSGGGGGPGDRNDFTFELAQPWSLLFGRVVSLTGRPLLEVYSDRNCPKEATAGEPAACASAAGARGRASGARFIVEGALEISLSTHLNLFAAVDGVVLGGSRAALTARFSPLLPATDAGIYGRMGITLKL